MRLLDPREQKDRVVRGEAEDGRGEQHGLRLLEPVDTGAVLEHEHEHAERRSDRERVHDERLNGRTTEPVNANRSVNVVSASSPSAQGMWATMLVR